MITRISVTAALLATAAGAALAGTASADAAAKAPTQAVLVAFTQADHGKLDVHGSVVVRRHGRWACLEGGTACLQIKAHETWKTIACTKVGADYPHAVRLTITWPRPGSIVRLFHPATTTTLASYDRALHTPSNRGQRLESPAAAAAATGTTVI